MNMHGQRHRVIIVGGGLSGCLSALALNRMRPETDVLLLEEQDHFGGDHIWSYFDDDVEERHRTLLEPLIVKRWPAHEVRFPARRRVLDMGYNSISSVVLDRIVRDTLGAESWRLQTHAGEVAPDHVVLTNGERLAADAVIDARGDTALPGMTLGWQKFVGHDYRFARPHGLSHPIIMDATVDQHDGYRFVYCLPWSDTAMLVEDTYYTLDPGLDAGVLDQRIANYVKQQGWQVEQLVRKEQGVLPIAMNGGIAALWADAPVARLGLMGGFFHPATGYSLPDAVRNAYALAAQADLSGKALLTLFRQRAEHLWQRGGFYRMLNRMLFHAAREGESYRMLEHFYGADAGVIGRFYAGKSGLADKMRILSGRPPVPIGRAISVLLGKRGA